MKFGFLTWCFPSLKLQDVLTWASQKGFECVGLDRWPWDVNEAKELFARNELHITSLGTPVNLLDPDKKKQKDNIQLVKRMIVHAEKLGVDIVDIFAGRDYARPVEESFKPYQKMMAPLAKFAAHHGRKLAIENCPMMHDCWPGGTNIAYSPAIWETMFDLVPDKNVGLTFDPAHFIWLGMDYLQAVKTFGKRIFHVHVKDCEILEDTLAVESILGHGWWRYRMPGWGEVNWPAFLSALLEAGFDGDLNLEHEDPLFGFDDLARSTEKVKKGLLAGQKYLSQYLAK